MRELVISDIFPAAPVQSPARRIARNSTGGFLLSIFTLELWCLCLIIGIVGIAIPHRVPNPPAKPPTLVEFKTISVAITADITPALPTPQQADAPAAPADTPPQAPPPPNDIAPPPSPSLADLVAAPSPDIAFAVPTQAPVTSASPHPGAPSPPVQHLTFGQGAAVQPSPEYPREAAIAHQEGVVTVVFTVDESGRVSSADANPACPWPLLNQAAIRAVRDTWRFPPGPVRYYDCSITFQLTRK